MKLRLLVTAVALSATAYAQKPKEVEPSYTTEPVTYQAAHCPDGYQLQRWENHDMAMMVATIGVYSPSGYYPVWDGPPAANPHPDKCVEIGITIPSQKTPIVDTSGTWAAPPVFEHSDPVSFASEGFLIIFREDGKSEIIPVNDKSTIQFIPESDDKIGSPARWKYTSGPE